MRDVAVVSFASFVADKSEKDEVEMLAPVIGEAIAKSGVPKRDIGFTVSGSCDYLGGRPFSFVMALDAVGAWPPISESHVEMDGAWALYEAWVRLQHGDIDAALVYAFGRSSQGSLEDVLVAQLDPYLLAPLWPDASALAGLQARAMVDAKKCMESDIVPLKRAPSADAAVACVLVAGERAKRVAKQPAWIRGIDHRIEGHSLGARDLTRSPSTELAAKKAGAHGRAVDVAELHAPYAHQEILLREALSLPTGVPVNPDRLANPFIVAGLQRIGAAASHILEGKARSAIAHATSGPCLQQNLVCLLEAST